MTRHWTDFSVCYDLNYILTDAEGSGVFCPNIVII